MKTLSRLKKVIPVVLALTISICGLQHVKAADWKGPSDGSEGSFGGLAGLGIVDNSNGFSLIGTASKKVIKSGFIPDITNPVSFEGQFGPVFLSGATAWFYSAHLRWDFEKDSIWTFYALGGLGGNILSVNSSTRFELFPRFGIGAFWKVSPLVFVRGEISHELIALGINIPF
jgi:hypothetical protein